MRLVWDRLAGPNLAVWMRIARPHRSPAIFENLDIIYMISCSQIPELICPHVNHFPGIPMTHSCESQVMSRRKTHYPANSGFTLGYDQIVFVDLGISNIRQESREVVIEDKSGVILRIVNPARPL